MCNEDIEYTEKDVKNSIATFRMLMSMAGLGFISQNEEISTQIWKCGFILFNRMHNPLNFKEDVSEYHDNLRNEYDKYIKNIANKNEHIE